MKCSLAGVLSAVLCFFAFMLSSGADQPDYKSPSEVRSHFKPKGPEPKEWRGEASVTGASSMFMSTTETRWHDSSTGAYLYSDFSSFISITMKGGTVVALPNEDFRVEDEFTYVDSDGHTIVEGKYVSVGIGISSPGKSPSPTAAFRTVKNLCESGMAVPAAKGKPGRIVALKKAAKMRFGASNVDVYYHDHQNSRVRMILWKCVEAKEHPEVKALYYEGQRRK